MEEFKQMILQKSENIGQLLNGSDLEEFKEIKNNKQLMRFIAERPYILLDKDEKIDQYFIEKALRIKNKSLFINFTDTIQTRESVMLFHDSVCIIEVTRNCNIVLMGVCSVIVENKNNFNCRIFLYGKDSEVEIDGSGEIITDYVE